MARKSIDVTITPENSPSADGRDNGKTFRITEMSAYDAEKWALRANMALLPKLSQDLTPEALEQIHSAPGMMTLQRLGMVLGGLIFEETNHIMDDLIARCVQYVPDARNPGIVRPIGMAGAEDIEEASTYATLRREAMNLHSNFTLAAALLELISVMSTWAPTWPTSQTSPEESEPLLLPERPVSRNFRRSIR
jgi:hypothetical protein